MTPQEKAIELRDKFIPYADVNDRRENLYNAKRCALIAVEYLIKEDEKWLEDYGSNHPSEWLEVKQEIEKL